MNRCRLLGRRDEAAQHARRAVTECDLPAPRTRLEAFAAITENDQSRFVDAVGEGVKYHKKEYQAKAHLADGAVYLSGMMLSKLAVTEGWTVPPSPYLPLEYLSTS